MGEAVTEHARRRKIAPWTAGGMLACALLLVAPTARADDSLWGKAMNTIGLGGNGASNQGAPAQQPAAPAQQPVAPAPQPAAPAPQPAALAPQPAPAAQAAPAAAAPGDNQNLLPNFFGWGHHDDSQPTTQAAIRRRARR